MCGVSGASHGLPLPTTGHAAGGNGPVLWGCEERYRVTHGGGAIRRALFRLERGVCTACGADCHGLTRRLQGIEKGAPCWESHRTALIKRQAPRFLERGFGKLLERLVKSAVDGNAWHADHIVPVFRGGGACGLENLRTLCAPCHADVTKRQAKERAAERQLRKQGTLDSFVTVSSVRVKKVRPQMKRLFGDTLPPTPVSSSDSESDSNASKRPRPTGRGSKVALAEPALLRSSSQGLRGVSSTPMPTADSETHRDAPQNPKSKGQTERSESGPKSKGPKAQGQAVRSASGTASRRAGLPFDTFACSGGSQAAAATTTEEQPVAFELCSGVSLSAAAATTGEQSVAIELSSSSEGGSD